jgi:septal ring factor EnvC (AmiA/AmiB activator)
MNKKLSILACSVAFVGMGMGMPQCPGEKAAQQQMDSLQQSNQDMTKKLQALDGEIKSMNGDLSQTKQLMTQLAAAVTAQKDAMDRMDAAVKDLQAKAAAAPKATKGKKKGR